MSATPMTIPGTEPPWELPSRGRVGMLSLIAAESAIFIIFVVAYLYYSGKSLTGPTPNEVLRIPVFYTLCLLSSSLTIHFAIRGVRHGNIGTFSSWWFVTVALGTAFLYGTAREWYRLIFEDGLTIRTNLFGTTYYSLVGLHGFHVVIGLILLSTVWIFTALGHVGQEHAYRLDVLSLYWHFVDAVWVVVFTVVYVIGR
uniref:Cytochrome c oxidase, subunit III n=1 Tax=Solibacter usitatus (strain Ellin6076) TaxID=234267 RepID=Q01PD0_SOLUE